MPGELCREWLGQHHVGTRFTQKLGTPSERGQHGRRQVGRKEARWMGIEGQGHGIAAAGARDAPSFLQQGAVAQMDAIEVANGNRRATQRSPQLPGDVVATADELHSLRDTGQIPLRQITAISTSASLSHLIGPMTSDRPPRPWPYLQPALFGVALVLYASVMPLGLSRVDGASQVAEALELGTGTTRGFFALLATRLGQYLPLGDTPARATFVSAVFCALAVAIAARLALRACMLLRPPANARQEERHFAHEPIAAAGAGLALAFSLTTFELGVTATTAAPTLALLLGAVLAGFALLRDHARADAAYVLAALAGFSAGVDSVAGPLLWPLLLGLSIWALRKGARWPLMAPLCFVAAWGASALAAVAVSSTTLTLGELLSGMQPLGVHSRGPLSPVLVELADEVGVIGSLLAVIGAVALAARSTLLAAWLVLTVVVSLLFAASSLPGPVAAPTRSAFPLAASILCTLAGTGLVHIANRLGRARAAGAFALAAILVASPALDGGARRWTHRAISPMHLLDRALARAQIRHVVCPGTPEMEGLFHLAKAQGLRPDLALGRCDGR